jgi:hypothetical protein
MSTIESHSGSCKVALIGPVGIDILTDLSLSEEHEKNHTYTRTYAGGVCRNIALDLTAIGINVILITQDYSSSLTEYRISTPSYLREKYIQTPVEYIGRLGIYRATFDGNDITEHISEYEFAQSVFNKGAAINLSPFLKDFNVLITCSDVSEDFWFNLPRLSKSNEVNLKCLVTSGVPLPQNYLAWLPYCDLFFINKEEAICLGFSPAEMCLEARKLGVKKVFVTLGKDGGVYYSDEQNEVMYVDSPKHPCKIVSPIGAGDAFAAGVIYGLISNYSLRRAIEIGLLSATFKLMREGSAFTEKISIDDLRKTTDSNF